MKWGFILSTAILCLALPNGAFAQRTLPGQQGIQLTTGWVNSLNTQKGFYLGASFSQYAKRANKWIFGIESLEKRHPYKDISIPQSQFTAEGGYLYNFLSDASKTFFVSVGASAMIGYETVNWNDKLLPDGTTINNPDAFLYGGVISLELETYLTDRLVLLANVRERLLMGSSVGGVNTQIGIGIKIIIN
jgi:hypothetical protein